MAQIRLIGTDPSQVPTNGMLGSLAFQSAESVSIEKLVVTGDVGIGTLTPASRLEIVGNASYDAKVTFNRVPVQTSNDGVIGELFFQNNTDSIALISVKRQSASDDAYIQFATQQSGGGLTERLRITSTGTVNIVGAGTAGSTQAVSFNGSAPANSLVLDSNGRVGIGNPTPAEKLDVFGRFRLFDGGYPYIDIGISTSNYFRLIHDNPNDRFYIGKNNNPTLVITGGNHVEPGADATQDFGSAAKRWANIYSADLQLSNEGSASGNEIDGTWGSYTIQEGEEALYLINRRSGKKFKFILEEVE